MRRPDRFAMVVFALAALAGTAALLGGCERIPEHVMNSPPALNRPRGENLYQRDPAPEAPPTDLSPPAAEPAPHPQDRLASFPNGSSSPDRRAHVAANALARIGAHSVPALVAELDSEDSQRRQRAAQTLARIGPAAIDAAEPLVARLEDRQEEPLVRLACAEALKEMGPVLWPVEPQPYLASPPPEPAAELTDAELANPQLLALAELQTTRRIAFEERSERQQQQHELRMQNYHRRSAIAERAIAALKQLAMD